jgi:hypothetical protein
MKQLPQLYEISFYDHGIELGSEEGPHYTVLESDEPRELQFMEAMSAHPLATSYSVRRARPNEVKALIKAEQKQLARQKRQAFQRQFMERYVFPKLDLHQAIGFLALSKGRETSLQTDSMLPSTGTS